MRIAVTLIATVVSFFAYGYSLNLEHQRAKDAFRNLAKDSSGALDVKMGRYLGALDSGAAMYNTHDHVDLEGWRTFTKTLQVDQKLPGILGLGYIVAVDRSEIGKFLDRAGKDGIKDMTIHPDRSTGPVYVIKYIEPAEQNMAAIGLNIAFEEGRRRAAETARDTGIPQITQRIDLVQDSTKKPGFLVLRAHYEPGASLRTVKERRAAFLGWVYAPFIGADALTGLTNSQGEHFEIAAYQGTQLTPEALIFQSADVDLDRVRYVHSEQMDVIGKTWTLRWTSTPSFEAAQKTLVPLFILMTGLGLTLLIYGLISMVLRREQEITLQVAFKTRELKALKDETRSVWENAVVPIIVLSDAGLVISNNPAARELLGEPGSARHRQIINRLAPNVKRRSTGSRRHLIDVVLPNEYLLLDAQFNCWTAPNGDERTTMIVQNVTEERAAIQQVEDTERRWDLALSGAKIGVFDVNLETGSSVVSQTWRDLMCVPPAYAGDTQEYFLSRVHPEDMQKIVANDAACMNGDTERSITEFRIKTGEDDWRWMRSDAVIVERDSKGNAIRMVGAQTDISDIRRASEELEASHTRFQLLLENAPVGMSILDEHGVFLGVNPAMCALVGYSKDELLDTGRFTDLFAREDVVTILQSVGSRASNRVQTYQAEHIIRQKDGSEIWGLLSVSWGYDPVQKRDIFIAQVQDITEQKNVEKLKNSFVATVSHELRTPLTSVKGALGLVRAKSGDADTATQNRLIEIASNNTDRLIDLVNDILDFEKIMAGEMEFHLTEVNLLDSIREAEEMIQPFATTHGAAITLDLPDEPIFVQADSVRLAQVLANLLSNACKFSADEGEVRIKVEMVDGKAVVYVMDNGKGVPNSFHSSIFRPFSQADGSDTRSKAGTGLGLSISRQIVKRLGGRIGFESPSQGLTVFWFSLPAVQRAKTRLRLVTEYPQPAGTIKMLHIEDDVDFAEIIGSGFDNSVDVTLAVTMRQARSCLARDTFDVIVVDWSLPDGDATELLDEIERLQPDTAIIGLSAKNLDKFDARVCHEIVKSKQDLGFIVDKIHKTVLSA